MKPRCTYKAAAAALLGVLACLSWAAAQNEWPVEVLIPELLSVRAPSEPITFELSHANYPPLSFPAIYPGSMLPVQLHASLEGSWTLSLEVGDIIAADGLQLVPASQIMYRVNEGSWLRANGFPQVIHSQNGPTLGWFELTVEFAFELTGLERAGNYEVTAVLTAESEEF